MKIEGTYKIPARREIVWQGLMNPEVLARSLPGCQGLRLNGDGSYSAEMNVGIAAVKGSYHGSIGILDAVAPERYRLKVEGQGTGGFLKGEGLLTLAGADGATVISYLGDAQVGGLIASVGQRLFLAAARQIVSRFFEEFSKQVQQTPSPTAAPGPTGAQS
jgi:hypothetical protein